MEVEQSGSCAWKLSEIERLRKVKEIEAKVSKKNLCRSITTKTTHNNNKICSKMIEEETQRRVEMIIKKKVDFILESRKQEIEDEINKRVSLVGHEDLGGQRRQFSSAKFFCFGFVFYSFF